MLTVSLTSRVFGIDPRIRTDNMTTAPCHRGPRIHSHENDRGPIPTDTLIRLIGINDGVTLDDLRNT